MHLAMSRPQFLGFLKSIKPTKYELMTDSAVRTLKDKSTTYTIYNWLRFYYIVQYALKYLENTKPVICDFGVFPGALINIIHNLFPKRGIQPVLHGFGISLYEDFVRIMDKDFSCTTLPVNFDPSNPDLRSKNYPARVPLEDDSVDIVFATEIIEHLMNPFVMIGEARRVLKPGGILIVTTPNVTRIGSIFKLMAGISNFDRLTPVGYSNTEDEWRPHSREYSMQELTSMFEQCQFQVLSTVSFAEDIYKYAVGSNKQKLIEVLKKPFYVFPHLRGKNLIVLRKQRPQ